MHPPPTHHLLWHHPAQGPANPFTPCALPICLYTIFHTENLIIHSFGGGWAHSSRGFRRDFLLSARFCRFSRRKAHFCLFRRDFAQFLAESALFRVSGEKTAENSPKTQKRADLVAVGLPGLTPERERSAKAWDESASCWSKSSNGV